MLRRSKMRSEQVMAKQRTSADVIERYLNAALSAAQLARVCAFTASPLTLLLRMGCKRAPKENSGQ
jgi:hypothetical protein